MVTWKTLCTHPKFFKGQIDSVKEWRIGKNFVGLNREKHNPGPHSDWFWNIELAGGGLHFWIWDVIVLKLQEGFYRERY